jgi:hypothetical protein
MMCGRTNTRRQRLLEVNLRTAEAAVADQARDVPVRVTPAAEHTAPERLDEVLPEPPESMVVSHVVEEPVFAAGL